MLKTRGRLIRIGGAAIALAWLGLLPASAQSALSCTMTSVPTLLRAEGLTELIGDIVLTCAGGVPTPANRPIPQANVTVYLPANVTSRILSNGGSEALLLIDEPGTALNPIQRVCGSITGCVVQGTGGAGQPFDGSGSSRPNIFQGTVSANSVTFQGVPVESPGASGIRTYRITNVRMNASALGATGTNPLPVIANVAISGSTSLPVDSPQRTVGTVTTSLTFAAGSVTSPECATLSRTGQYAGLVYTEAFAAAFKTRTIAGADPTASAVQDQPGANYNLTTESGLVIPSLPGAGLADFGTRFKAVFKNIPAGVSIFVSTKNLGSSSTTSAQLVPSESGPYQELASTETISFIDAVQLPITNGTATAVWEVTAAHPGLVEDFVFAMFFEASGLKAGQTVPTVNGSYAPAYLPGGDASKAQPATFPIPRFADTSVASNVISVTPCQTILLFPYVVSDSGFDTGMAISNTSTDPVGTAAQSGTCTLNPFGSGAGQAFTTPTLASGTSYTVLASTAMPGFRGYVFAVCNFQYGHGFAFISDVGARNLAMGYLPLVVPDPTTLLARPGAPPGETLGK